MSALRRALKSAHSSRGAKPKTQRDGYWAEDAEASFWQRTESAFWTAYRALLAGTFDELSSFRGALARAARSLFDEHTAASADDASKVDVLARARRRLQQDLHSLVNPGVAAAVKRGTKVRAKSGRGGAA